MRSILKMAALKMAAASLALLGVATAAAAQDGPIRWKMQSAFPLSLPVTGPLSKLVVERLDTMSDGQISIRLFEPGALVPALQTFDSVGAGAIETGWASAGFWTGKIPAAVVPYRASKVAARAGEAPPAAAASRAHTAPSRG